MFKKVRQYFLRKFRETYENRIQVNYGIMQFLANFAFIQISNEESITLNPPSAYGSDIVVTTSGSRPVLTYRYWPKGKVYDTGLPSVEVIVEKSGFFQVREAGSDQDWEIVRLTDERIAPLKDMFLGFAFYPPLRAEWKKTNAA